MTTDRGVYSQTNENYAQSLGVKEVILPKGGYRSQERIKHERKTNFKKARRWHPGSRRTYQFFETMFWLTTLFISGRVGILSLGWLGNYRS